MSLISAQRRRPRVALFFSGTGSTLQALLDQIESLNIVCAFSSKKLALGRLRCRRQGLIESVYKFPEDFGKVLEILKAQQIDTVMLVGFMKIVPADFVEQFKSFSPFQRIVNIHPSILPSHKGLRAIESAFSQQSPLGVTIHDVVAEVDSGDYFKRTMVLSSQEISLINLEETFLWARACEQQILKSWGSAVA